MILQLLQELKDRQCEAVDLVSDEAYVKKSSDLVYDALEKGSDILQLPNGDIVITETKTVTYQYHWNQDTMSFEKTIDGRRVRKKKHVSSKVSNHIEEAA